METRPLHVLPLRILSAALACQMGLSIWFVSPWFPMQSLIDVQMASGGWISVTLIASSLIGACAVSIVRCAGGHTLATLGWKTTDLPAAVLVTSLLWLFLNLGALAGSLGSGQAVALNADLVLGHPGRVFGPLLAQLLGTALMEETLFRAFLLGQIRARLPRRMHPVLAAATALIVSQAIFALMHVPIIHYRGLAFLDMIPTLAVLFCAGCFLAFVYLSTRNLFIAVGVHALMNAPALAVEPSELSPMPLLLALAGALGLFHLVRRRSLERPDATAIEVMAPR